MPNKYILSIFLCLPVIYANAQSDTIKFSKDGIYFKGNPCSEKCPIFKISSNNLEYRLQLADTIKEKLDRAISQLSIPGYPEELAEMNLGFTNSEVNNLTIALQSALKSLNGCISSKDFSSLNLNTANTKIPPDLENLLKGGKESEDKLDTTIHKSYHSVNYTRADQFKRILIQHYKNSPADPIKERQKQNKFYYDYYIRTLLHVPILLSMLEELSSIIPQEAFEYKQKLIEAEIKNIKNANATFTDKYPLSKDYFLHWLWFTEGKLRLNPFPATSPKLIPTIGNTPNEVNLMVEFYETMLVQAKKSGKLGKEEAIKQALIKFSAGNVFNLLKNYNDSIKSVNELYWNDFLIVDKLIYKGDIYVPENKTDKLFAYHRMVNNTKELLNKENVPPYFEKGFTVIQSLHNVKAGYSIEESEPTITDLSEKTPVARFIDQYIQPISDNYAALSSKNFALQMNKMVANNREKSVENLTESTESKTQVERKNKINDLYDCIEKIVKLFTSSADFHFIGQYLPPKSEDLVEKEDELPTYFTKNFIRKEETAAKSITQNFTVTKTGYNPAKFSQTYKVASRTSLHIFAGLEYTLPDINKIEITEKEVNGVKVLESVKVNEDQIRMIIGLKFHPFSKGMISIDQRFNPKSWKEIKSRFSVMGGIGIPKPLENLYLGFGYDIIPGLTFGGGIHFLQNTEYQIENNVILSSKTKYQPLTPFLTISIDPGSLLKLAGILAP